MTERKRTEGGREGGREGQMKRGKHEWRETEIKSKTDGKKVG